MRGTREEAKSVLRAAHSYRSYYLRERVRAGQMRGPREEDP